LEKAFLNSIVNSERVFGLVSFYVARYQLRAPSPSLKRDLKLILISSVASEFGYVLKVSLQSWQNRSISLVSPEKNPG